MRPDRRPPRLTSALLAGTVLGVVLFAGDRPAPRAAGTEPTLGLVEADAFATASDAVTVTATGTFSFDDLVQFSFPAGMLVVQDIHFARFDFAGTAPAEGTDPAVADGVTPEEIPALISGGQPAGEPAALLTIQPDRVMVSLPSSFVPGAASVLVFAVIGGNPFVSNTLGVTIP